MEREAKRRLSEFTKKRSVVHPSLSVPTHSNTRYTVTLGVIPQRKLGHPWGKGLGTAVLRAPPRWPTSPGQPARDNPVGVKPHLCELPYDPSVSGVKFKQEGKFKPVI